MYIQHEKGCGEVWQRTWGLDGCQAAVRAESSRETVSCWSLACGELSTSATCIHIHTPFTQDSRRSIHLHHAFRLSSSADCVRLLHHCRVLCSCSDRAFVLHSPPESVSERAIAKCTGVCQSLPRPAIVQYCGYQSSNICTSLILFVAYAGDHTITAIRRKSTLTSSSIWIPV